MLKDLDTVFCNLELQKKIADTSYMGAEYLNASLSHLETLKMVVAHMREYGSDESMTAMGQHQIKEVEKVQAWLQKNENMFLILSLIYN